MTDYDDYYDAAKKDGEPFIQGVNGGVKAEPFHCTICDFYNGSSWRSCPYCGKTTTQKQEVD